MLLSSFTPGIPFLSMLWFLVFIVATPLSPVLKPRTGKDDTHDIDDIVNIETSGKSLEELVTGQTEIRLSGLDEDQVRGKSTVAQKAGKINKVSCCE